MRKFFLLLVFLLPVSTFASEWPAPVSQGSFGIGAINCDYFQSCSTEFRTLQKNFISALKQYKIWTAIATWEKMNPIAFIDSSSGNSSLFGAYAPEGIAPIPSDVMVRRSYKNGILYIGRHCSMECDQSDYYIGFLKYKKVNGEDILYVYNTPLAPKWSIQYNSYKNLYTPEKYPGTPDHYTAMYRDMISAFNKWKWNNKNTDSVYKSFVKSIK